jgi:hypothetical protein
MQFHQRARIGALLTHIEEIVEVLLKKYAGSLKKCRRLLVRAVNAPVSVSFLACVESEIKSVPWITRARF